MTPFLTADFSDIFAKESEAEVEIAIEEGDSSESNLLDDELDIDALIAEAQNEASNGADDIGDSLTEQITIESSDEPITESLSESALSQLLAEESLNDENSLAEDMTLEAIELAPDFTDEDVLADLLAETAEQDEQFDKVEELDVIKELDDVDFDELLANIEAESDTDSAEEDEVALTLDDIGDDLIDETLASTNQKTESEDYVSVEELLAEPLSEEDLTEPYENMNIDVGLDQFSENEAGIDVDEDGTMSSKLDLAKMYIELSDEENAQVILLEVIEKGNAVQQVEAKKILDAL